MMTTATDVKDELRELDRQWAELAGWICERSEFEEVYANDEKRQNYLTLCRSEVGAPPSVLVRRDYPPFSSDPSFCFGPGGPWEWLLPYMPDISVGADGRVECETFDALLTKAEGATIFEAITRCAIEMRMGRA